MAKVGEAIRIGVSSCLLGAKVRFDGGHKKDDLLVNTFGTWVEWVPVCPEVEVGMGTPRESVRLMRQRARAVPVQETRCGRCAPVPVVPPGDDRGGSGVIGRFDQFGSGRHRTASKTPLPCSPPTCEPFQEWPYDPLLSVQVH